MFVDANANVWWRVERTCGFKVEEENGQVTRHYLVKWMDSVDRTWEPYNHFSEECKKMIQVYLNTNITQAYPI